MENNQAEAITLDSVAGLDEPKKENKKPHGMKGRKNHFKGGRVDNLTIRINPESKAKIKTASQIINRTMSDFVLDVAKKEASRIIKRNAAILNKYQ